MTREPITISYNASLLECAKKMVGKRVGSLILVEGKELKGFISQSDILWAIIKKSKEDLENIKAKDISPRKIATIKSELTIKEAIQRMKKLKFNRLPVIKGKELVGMLTIKDILSFNPEFYPEMEELQKIREESEKLKRLGLKEKFKEGVCEECGNHGLIYKIDGNWICDSCKPEA
jgi:signal-transduction protein with cAMP-binding, CBS, and nucleotidyltransferase domain